MKILYWSRKHSLLQTPEEEIQWSDVLANVVVSKFLRRIQSSDLGRILLGNSEHPGSSMVGLHLPEKLAWGS